MFKSIYSKPKLCKSKNGWYVHFRYNGRQKRFKSGFNNIDDLKERELYFNELAKLLYKKLKDDWNPFDDISPDDDSMLKRVKN